MMDISEIHNDPVHPHSIKLEHYYRMHASLYDATRWSFLFGRRRLLENLPDLIPNPNILEVGCGTGRNIKMLDHLYPDGRIYGIDLSRDMLKKAHKKVGHSNSVSLLNGRYGKSRLQAPPFDLVLLSYSLTMSGDSPGTIVSQVNRDLKPGGYVAVVDFHTSPLRLFRRWMALNHVQMEGKLLQRLQKHFNTGRSQIRRAYFGLWSYFQFIGQRVQQ